MRARYSKFEAPPPLAAHARGESSSDSADIRWHGRAPSPSAPETIKSVRRCLAPRLHVSELLETIMLFLVADWKLDPLRKARADFYAKPRSTR